MKPLLGTAALATLLAVGAAADAPLVEVWKTPSCGCCAAWAEHMAAEGFAVETRDVDQGTLYRLKARLGLTAETASCHTATVDGYVVEGHVPADDVRRLLAERPDAAGLAVPGMPIGSPGMEMGDARDAFDTLLLDGEGGATVYARHR
jgi:hypothetical protein